MAWSTVTPHALGMGWVLSGAKEFLGKRSYARAAHTAGGRKQLVSVLPVDRTLRLPEGTQLVEAAALGDYTGTGLPNRPVPMLGHVTSSYHSQVLGRSFALALVKDGRNRIRQTLLASFQGRFAEVQINDAVLYDKEGGSGMAELTMTRTTTTAITDTAIASAAVHAYRRSPASDLAEEMAQGSSAGAVLWLAPDEFLVVGPDEAESGVVATRLAATLAAQPGQVVDVSANRTTLELSGPRAREVLDKSCRLDLHPREFPVGQALVTLLESVGVILWRTGEDTWRVMPRGSFSTHVVRWLLDGMREFR